MNQMTLGDAFLNVGFSSPTVGDVNISSSVSQPTGGPIVFVGSDSAPSDSAGLLVIDWADWETLFLTLAPTTGARCSLLPMHDTLRSLMQVRIAEPTWHLWASHDDYRLEYSSIPMCTGIFAARMTKQLQLLSSTEDVPIYFVDKSSPATRTFTIAEPGRSTSATISIDASEGEALDVLGIDPSSEDVELDSPPFTPHALVQFRAKDFVRSNRWSK